MTQAAGSRMLRERPIRSLLPALRPGTAGMQLGEKAEEQRGKGVGRFVKQFLRELPRIYPSVAGAVALDWPAKPPASVAPLHSRARAAAHPAVAQGPLLRLQATRRATRRATLRAMTAPSPSRKSALGHRHGQRSIHPGRSLPRPAAEGYGSWESERGDVGMGGFCDWSSPLMD
jgi:hypothetical protein